MNILEFIGFIVLMVAAIILSFKTSKEKRESLKRFEKEEEESVKAVVKPVKAAQLPAVPPKKMEKTNPAFDGYANKPKKKENPLQKISIREAIIIQTILERPKSNSNFR